MSDEHQDLYVKNDDGTFEYIGKEWGHENLAKGHWLIRVAEGTKSYIPYHLDPKYADVEAALKELHQGIVDHLHKINEARPKTRPLTKKEQKAMKAYYDIMGKEKTLMFECISYYEFADRMVDYIREKKFEKVRKKLDNI